MKELALRMLIASCLLAMPATAKNTEGASEARIPFASSVRDLEADGRDAIYVQDAHRKWYRGTFFAPCNELPFATVIGFGNRSRGGLDKWSTIYVRGERCLLASFTMSDAPPNRQVKIDRKNKVSHSARTI